MKRQKKPIIAFLLLLAGLTLVGCSSDNNDSPAVEGDSGANIQGQWIQDCMEMYGGSENFELGAQRASFEFKEAEFTRVFASYSDNSCSQPKNELVAQGTFIFGKAVVTPSGLSANELDLQTDTGKVWKGLVTVDANGTMRLALDYESGRPTDLDSAFQLTKE